MAKLVLLFVCVAVFQLANALQCYHCKKDQCDKDMSTWQKSQCAKSADPKMMPACLKYIYKDADSQKETASRECILVEKNQKYKCSPMGQEISCETCETDLCNSAPGVSFSFAATLGVVLALIVPKFLA